MSQAAPEPKDGCFEELLGQVEEQNQQWERIREQLARAGDVEFVVESPLERFPSEPVVPCAHGVRA